MLAPYFAVPDSTTLRTIELADDLAVDGSTYDTILAYERWLSTNTVYDLNAPVPGDDADAVDDYLFESRRGFCEQIASSLVVMLRSQGVPARLATGYIPGERDRVSGVWEVRASDAHAWVEVWFPDTGWQAFDPTASVPLSGETEPGTVGGDVAGAILSTVTERPIEIALVVGAAMAMLGAVRALRELRRRRERGPWGLLADRFAALGTDPTQPAPRTADDIARAGWASDADIDPHAIATTLDRVAFAPNDEPPDRDLSTTRRAIRHLERSTRTPRRPPR